MQWLHCRIGIIRSQRAFELWRQPEQCQQAAEVTISLLRTASQSSSMQSAWFRGDMQGMSTQERRVDMRCPSVVGGLTMHG
jgi:hypothetical protein